MLAMFCDSALELNYCWALKWRYNDPPPVSLFSIPIIPEHALQWCDQAGWPFQELADQWLDEGHDSHPWIRFPGRSLFSVLFIDSNTYAPIQNHGRLTSRCCWIDSRFVLKIADYGLPSFFETTMPLKPDNAYFQTLLWKAPEDIQRNSSGTQEGDVYSFGIILQEIILREEPFSMFQLPAEGTNLTITSRYRERINYISFYFQR